MNTSISQNLLKNLPGMLYRCEYNSSWTITYLNNGCNELTGLAPEELLNNSLRVYTDLIFQEDKKRVKQYFSDCLDDKMECDCEYRIVTTSGKLKWVKEIANGIYGKDGKLLFFEGYITDITEKKEHKQAVSSLAKHLNESAVKENRLRALLNGIPDVLLRIDEEGNCSAYKSDDSLIVPPRNLISIFPFQIAKVFLHYTKRALAEDKSFVYEYDLTDANHNLSYFEARFVRSDENEVVCIIRNITAILKVNDSVALAKEFYENIIDNISIEIAVIDDKNRYQLVSKSAVKDEATRKWLIGKTDFEYCKEKDINIGVAESRTEMYTLVDELHKPVEWVEELLDEDGTKRFFVRTLKPFNTPDDKTYKISYGLDITALKSDQNEVMRREHLLAFSQKLAKVGYWVWHEDNHIHEWSDGIFDIIEENRKNVIPSFTTYLSYIHPDDRAEFKAVIQSAKENKTSYSIQYRIVTRHGKLKHVREESSNRYPEKGGSQYLFGMVQDISEIRVSRDALARSEGHFRAIAESSPIFIIEISTDYKITYLNVLKDKRRNAVIGASIFDFVLDDYQDSFKERLDNAISSGAIESMELQAKIKESITEWYDVSIGPVKDDAGVVQSVIILAQNISEKKQSEYERERVIKEINNRYDELMQFNYIVSHNLRSPIANILGMSYILNPDTPAEDVKKIFDYIMQSAESIDTLIKDLNDVLTARSPLNEKHEEFLLTEIIGSVCVSLDQQMQDSHLVICIDVDEDANTLTSVKSYVQSIIHNLISNSIKYKALNRQLQVTVMAWREGANTVIEVSDNGIGIDLNQYGGQMFGLYKRFTSQNEGKGLGLHMTKAQVEALGGTISVDSELDKGSTFKIILPN